MTTPERVRPAAYSTLDADPLGGRTPGLRTRRLVRRYGEPVTAQAAPFLMFQGGVGREAIDFYVSTFDGELLSIETYPEGADAPAGTIHKAAFRIAGQEVRATDSPITHGFGFTPSFSMWVDVESADEVDRLAAALGADGGVLMPVGEYPFSKRFTWLTDKYGVSWQLSLA